MPGVCPCGLFNDSDVPAVPAADDVSSTELGVAFTADTSGQVAGVRFYKGAGNAGPHTVSLWDGNGNQLATSTITDESTMGWQTALFAAPVTLTAGNTYIASYRAPAGRYSYTTDGLKSPIDKAPLHTPANSGRYTYGSGAPLNASSGNYYVDPVFIVPNLAPPGITSVNPGISRLQCRCRHRLTPHSVLPSNPVRPRLLSRTAGEQRLRARCPACRWGRSRDLRPRGTFRRDRCIRSSSRVPRTSAVLRWNSR